MTELKPFVKRTVLHRDRELVAAVEEKRFRRVKYIIGTEAIDSRYCGHSDERDEREKRERWDGKVDCGDLVNLVRDRRDEITRRTKWTKMI